MVYGPLPKGEEGKRTTKVQGDVDGVYVSRSYVSNSVGILWVIELQRAREICSVGNWALFPLIFLFDGTFYSLG